MTLFYCMILSKKSATFWVHALVAGRPQRAKRRAPEPAPQAVCPRPPGNGAAAAKLRGRRVSKTGPAGRAARAGGSHPGRSCRPKPGAGPVNPSEKSPARPGCRAVRPRRKRECRSPGVLPRRRIVNPFQLLAVELWRPSGRRLLFQAAPTAPPLPGEPALPRAPDVLRGLRGNPGARFRQILRFAPSASAEARMRSAFNAA